MSKKKRNKNNKKKNNKNVNKVVPVKTLEETANKETIETVENVNVEENTSIPFLRKMSVYLVMAVIGVGMFIGILFAIRPTTSPIEQRDLAKFPEFTVESFFDGSYFADIALWYADTYPTREYMIAADKNIKSMYGIDTGISMIGNDIVADEIPTVTSSKDDMQDNMETDEMLASSSEISDAINDSEDSAISGNVISDNAISENVVSDNSLEAEESISENETDITADTKPKYDPNKLPSSTAMEEEIKQNIQQNLYVKDGAAYSKYYFSLNSATKYIDALEHAAERLDGKANVINILVPNQSGAMLPYDEMLALGGSNQIEAIHYYYSQYNKVQPVETIDTLREHQDEYLYFKTDHHWTATGAYYVYRNFCELKGFKPHELSYYKEMTFDPFLGSFYSQLQDPVMAENPDYVKAYVPHGTNDLTYWDVQGVEHKWQVITDVSKWNKYSGYCAFVGGDKPLAIINNPEITDGSSCLVIKESYGNCFIPFLVDHYQTVYIMDCRYSTENYVDYVIDNDINDLIFINNITIIGATGVCNRIAMMVE